MAGAAVIAHEAMAGFGGRIVARVLMMLVMSVSRLQMMLMLLAGRLRCAGVAKRVLAKRHRDRGPPLHG